MKSIAIRETITPTFAEADILYARSYRWLFYTTNHPKVCTWMKRIKGDFLNCVLHFEMYEDTTGEASGMLAAIEKPKTTEEIILDHLGPKGEPLFTLKFSGLKVIKHTVKYDYKGSEALTHRVAVQFKKMQRIAAQ